METALLKTKFYIPPARPERVSRPHLIERLGQGIAPGGKLTLVSAPAGFGKTTLVSEWVHSLRDTVAVAWLSLDESDNDLTRFLTYFIAALNQVKDEAPLGQGIVSALQSPQPPPAEDVLITLINEITTFPTQIVFVLDDYHLIEDQSIHDALTFLLRRLPPQLHLIIATREDPPLPLARLRARSQLTELRATDLRFTSSEAAEFLNQVMGLNLSAEDVNALEKRTEGWIAGLQLAALALQATLSTHNGQDTANFIKSFSGSHRFVLDYLIEEVLEQQSEDIQTFLLHTAILDRLSGALCDAVTGQDTGQAILEALERSNLFIVPLDEARVWYRYHHLFASLLRQRLHQTHPEQVSTLHIRASTWYEQNEVADEAIEHALRAEDFEHATYLIAEYADAVWQRGEHDKLLRLLNRLPVELIFSNPHLCIFYAWYSFIGGQQDATDRSLQAAEQALDASAPHATETEAHKQNALTQLEKLRGRAVAVRAFMSARQGDVQRLIPYAHQALEHLPEEDHTWRSMTALTLGDVYGFKGDMTAAYAARIEAYNVCKASGDTYYAMLASMKLAITLRSQGQLQQVIALCRQQIQLANECGLSTSPLKGLLLAILGEVLVELDDRDQALHQVILGVEMTERGVDVTFIGWAYMCLMRIKFSRGEFADVEEILQKMENIAQESNVPPWIMNQMGTWQTRVWLAQGKLEAASQWAREHELDINEDPKLPHDMNFFLLFDYVLLARILMAQNRWGEATALLQQLLKAAEAGGRISNVIEILILQALVMQAEGDTPVAMATLQRALALAEPEGFIRAFVDEGPPMARLLYEAMTCGIAPDYARRLLAAFPDAEPEPTAPAKSQASQSDLIEPLSDRELEVLQLIAEGLTNPEIARQLYLSLNTIKSHTRNIYGKLGVHNRTQAVARAQALGILSAT